MLSFLTYTCTSWNELVHLNYDQMQWLRKRINVSYIMFSFVELIHVNYLLLVYLLFKQTEQFLLLYYNILYECWYTQYMCLYIQETPYNRIPVQFISLYDFFIFFLLLLITFFCFFETFSIWHFVPSVSQCLFSLQLYTLYLSFTLF